MDPRALKATSVKAGDSAAPSPEPQALKITAASSNPKMFTLPWEKPLATWPEDLLANLPLVLVFSLFVILRLLKVNEKKANVLKRFRWIMSAAWSVVLR